MNEPPVNERKDWLGRGWAFPVNCDPGTGGIAQSEYEADIKESIRIILLTAPGERVMRPDFGCGIHDLVFDSVDVSMLTRVETSVREALTRYEARVELGTVSAVLGEPNGRSPGTGMLANWSLSNPYEGQLTVQVEYRIRRTYQRGNLVFPFYFHEGGVGVVEGSRR
jgi:phage baseplate assembly protein W